MLVTWYLPKATNTRRDKLGMWTNPYIECMQRKWVPSKETAEYIDMDIVISTWINICELKKVMDVCGCCYRTKKQRNLVEMFIGNL